MTIQLTVEMPEDAFSVLRKSPKDFAEEMKLCALAKWYEMGILSQEKAAHLAQMSRREFFSVLDRYGISPFQETPEELDEGLARG